MNGYQLTFFTGQNKRHGHQALWEWLMEQTKSLGIRGATVFMAEEGFGHDGRLHSAHFFELADQPVEITMVVKEDEAARIFQYLQKEKVSLFYTKTKVEFGMLGENET